LVGDLHTAREKPLRTGLRLYELEALDGWDI
jgi:hypothetical protein